MNSKLLFDEFVSRITLSESKDEVNSIAYLIFDHYLSLGTTAIIAEKEIQFDADRQKLLETVLERINKSEPVQYIIGEAEFFGRKFTVNPDVLIPRPETEELVSVVLKCIRSQFAKDWKPRIVDIGTGSGCIPITLKLEYSPAEVFATDVSLKALETARKNVTRYDAPVHFLEHDILASALPVKNLDLIVSNPPYIGSGEKKTMKKNVVEYEPHTALFVNDDDPLLFYRAIAGRGQESLNEKGIIIVEINERYGQEVADIFRDGGFAPEIFKDLSGKDRIVKAAR